MTSLYSGAGCIESSTLCMTVRAAAESGPQADGGVGEVVQSHSGDVD